MVPARTPINRAVVVTLIAIVLIACSGFYALGPYPPIWVTNDIRAAIGRFVRDPDATQLKSLRYSSVDADVVCGEMNAKNAFGAYAGFRKFAYVRERDFPFFEDADSSSDYMLEMFKCD